jgi:hypothetical protein
MADIEKKYSLHQNKYFFIIGFCQDFNLTKYGLVIDF